MWSVESSRDVAATPTSIWRYYADPTTWPRWAHNTSSARFDGPIEAGVEGRVKPQDGPEQTVRIVEAQPERLLVGQIRLPGAVMGFRYEIEPTHDGARIRHQVSMDGLLSGVYRLIVRKRNERQLPEETARLAKLVEATD